MDVVRLKGDNAHQGFGIVSGTQHLTPLAPCHCFLSFLMCSVPHVVRCCILSED